MVDEVLSKICANCRTPLPARANSGRRGRDIAWMVHCKECAALALDQMELLEDRPGGVPIQIWACKFCGMTRSCRPGWLARCQMCLDERTVLEPDEDADLQAALVGNAKLRKALAEMVGVRPREVTPKVFREVLSYAAAGAAVEKVEEPGWTVLGNDVYGLPWFTAEEPTSHGTWARHDACGKVGKLTEGRTECRTCPPAPGSRTHRARAQTPQLLYLVRYLDLLKFGHGDARRVRAHLRSGCKPVLVLKANHQDVVQAELALKRTLHQHLINPVEWNLPVSFGRGSEVVPDHVTVNLREVLAGAQHVEDVTSRFT